MARHSQGGGGRCLLSPSLLIACSAMLLLPGASCLVGLPAFAPAGGDIGTRTSERGAGDVGFGQRGASWRRGVRQRAQAALPPWGWEEGGGHPAVMFAAGMGSMAVAQRLRRAPPPPPGGGGGGKGGGGDGGSEPKTEGKPQPINPRHPWRGDWWRFLPGGYINPVYWWWRIKSGGPYTRLYINHINPLCKILAFSSKKMLTLQTLAMIGQLGQILDKSWRPTITTEHWWSIRYYSLFAVIHALRIRSILQEQKPILLSAEEMELYAGVFQANQFTPRQFISLRKLARKTTARAHALIKPPSVAMHRLILVVSGTLEVEVRGHVTNHISAGNFLGEVEFLQTVEMFGGTEDLDDMGKDMSIRATGNGTVTYLSWSFDDLAAHIRQSSHKSTALRLEALLAKQLANKLLETDMHMANRKAKGSKSKKGAQKTRDPSSMVFSVPSKQMVSDLVVDAVESWRKTRKT